MIAMKLTFGQLGTGKCLRCGQCIHFLAVKPQREVNPESRNYGGWCKANGVTTAPELLRCGGDDFKRRTDPFAPKEDA